MLSPVGITELEERCYRALLVRPDAQVGHLTAAMGIGRAQLRTVLGDLERKGLVSRTAGRAPRYVPTRPDVGIEALLLQRRLELDRVHQQVLALMEQYRSPTTPAEAQPVDLVTGREAIRQRWVQVQRSATEEIRLFDKPPYVMESVEPNPVEMELLGRGIRYRIVYDASSFDEPGKLAFARASIAAGEEARVYPSLPMKLIIADRAVALTHDIEGPVIQDAVIVHPHALLDALDAVFELIWDRATPLLFDEKAPPEPLDALDREILALLAAGSNDAAIARRLGIGTRTVRRRIAGIGALVGAETRFQVAVEASRRSWI